ncbi:MAG: MFS transporter [Candidatus Lambdaproteobacteria bacterium]|nr:MFS transporter [Candidatus Lambdaproteobacteria bacterium]
MTENAEASGQDLRRRATLLIVLLGLVSLFADMTYESARSINGPYLATLGAGALVVGVVAGAGELVGYALRVLAGIVSDRTQRLWSIVIAGYALNLLAVPLLALTTRWEAAAALILLERAGRAIRSPSRDAMLSQAAARTGVGWGFGLHEAVDQIGAVAGPLALGALLLARPGYAGAYAWLGLPALAAMACLLGAWRAFPTPQVFEPPAAEAPAERLRPAFWVYAAGAALLGAGFVDFPLIAFHLQQQHTAPNWAPWLYALAMGSDGVAALGLGLLFDRHGLSVMALAALCSALAVPLVFLGGLTGLIVGLVLWGVAMAAQESVLRAAIARLVPVQWRGRAYGTFNAIFGLGWFAGSALLGYTYDRSLTVMVALSCALQLASVPVFLAVSRRLPVTPVERR